MCHDIVQFFNTDFKLFYQTDSPDRLTWRAISFQALSLMTRSRHDFLEGSHITLYWRTRSINLSSNLVWNVDISIDIDKVSTIHCLAECKTDWLRGHAKSTRTQKAATSHYHCQLASRAELRDVLVTHGFDPNTRPRQLHASEVNHRVPCIPDSRVSNCILLILIKFNLSNNFKIKNCFLLIKLNSLLTNVKWAFKIIYFTIWFR